MQQLEEAAISRCQQFHVSLLSVELLSGLTFFLFQLETSARGRRRTGAVSAFISFNAAAPRSSFSTSNRSSVKDLNDLKQQHFHSFRWG